MKTRNILFFLSLIVILLLNVKTEKTLGSPSIGWHQTYGGTGNEEVHSVIQTSDGGYALAGWTSSFGASEYDFWLVKTDSSGNVQWNKTYGGSGHDEAYSVIQTSDGGYAITGDTWSFGAYDFWLVKTDEFGVVPETAWVILPLLLFATVSIIISKKKLFFKQYRK